MKVTLNEVTAGIAFAGTCITGKQRGIVVNFCDAAAQRGIRLHLRRIIPVSYTHLDVYKRQAISGSALGAVDVLPNNEIAVVFGILITGMELSFNGLLSLAMTGVASIDDNIHCFASPSICSSVSLSRAFIGEAGSKHISTNFCI